MNFSKLQQSLKDFDWRSLKKYTDPKAADDLNGFLEALPQHAGQTMLVIAGIAWAAAGIIGLYTTVQLQNLTELRAELESAQAVQPKVPKIKDIAVNAEDVEKFVKRIEQIYGGLKISSRGQSINITGDSTAAFGQFREAIGHVQSGGTGWRVSIDKFCVGRECERFPLSASLKINKVSVN